MRNLIIFAILLSLGVTFANHLQGYSYWRLCIWHVDKWSWYIWAYYVLGYWIKVKVAVKTAIEEVN